MSPYEARLIELVDTLQGTLDELRRHILNGQPGVDEAELQAFAEETERARDA